MHELKPINNLLSYVQINLVVPKSQYNSFGKYNFRNKEDILDAVKKLLPEGAHVTITDEIVLIGERFYVKATARLTYMGESVEAVAYAREPDIKKGMDSSQITGAASSYAGKYALGNLFAIDDTRDADSEHKPS